MIEAAPAHRIVHLARAVRGEDGDRRSGSLDRAKLRNGDLIVRQQLEEEGLERLIRAVELVDQQHRRPAFRRKLERLQQRTLQKVGRRVDVALDLPDRCRCCNLCRDLRGRRRDRPRGFHRAHVQELPRIVPLVGRRGEIEPLVALQSHERPVQRGGERLGDLGLADAGLAFEQKRPAEFEGEVDRRRQRVAGEIAVRGEQRPGLGDGCGQ